MTVKPFLITLVSFIILASGLYAIPYGEEIAGTKIEAISFPQLLVINHQIYISDYYRSQKLSIKFQSDTLIISEFCSDGSLISTVEYQYVFSANRLNKQVG